MYFIIRFVISSCLLLSVHPSLAQRELLYARDPASLRSEEIRITHFNLPAPCARYAGIRIMDIRPVRAFCGFIRPASQQPARKLSTAPDLETQLNEAVKIRKDSADRKDSLVVALKHFWLSRSVTDDTKMFCRVHAMFFSRRGDTLHYLGKADTLLSRNAVVRYEFRDLPALFMEDLLALFPDRPPSHPQPLSVQEWMLQAGSWIRLPVMAGRENGLLLSYPDFIQARLIPARFSMRAFDEQFTILFDDEELKNRYGNKLWGVLFNGELYIRNGRHYSRAYPMERSYMILNNIRKADGEYEYSYPLLLNLQSGKWE